MTETLAGYAGLSTVTGWRDTARLEDFGALAEPHRLQLGAPLFSPLPAPLFNDAALPERVVREHANRIAVPGAALLGVTGHELGSFGLLQQNGRVFVDPRIMPDAQFKPDRMPPHWVMGLLRADAEIVSSGDPLGVVLNPHFVWGHFLLEMLARLHLLAELRTLGRNIRVAAPRDAPGWVRGFIELYNAPSDILWYTAASQRVQAPCFVLPSMLMKNYHLHPMLNVVIEALLARLVPPGPPAADAPRRLYLSRSHHTGWHAVANEAEVEATMRDLGFTIFHPQDHSLQAQLAIYAHAECIVAPYSSAVHNALFAPRGTPVFCFGWMNHCQSAIANLRGQPVAYLPPESGELIFPPDNRPPGVFQLRVDCRALARDLPAFLRFAAQTGQRTEPASAAPLPPANPSQIPASITEAMLTAAAWRYGRDGGVPSTGRFQFLPNGQIGGYSHPNEQRWTLDGGVLALLNGQGQITAAFATVEQAGGNIVLRGRFQRNLAAGIVLRLERPRG